MCSDLHLKTARAAFDPLRQKEVQVTECRTEITASETGMGRGQ